MAKSNKQKLKRMQSRHPLLIAVGIAKILKEDGNELFSIEPKQKYDFRNYIQNLYIGTTPKEMETNAFAWSVPINGQRIYIESISKIDVSKKLMKIEYRILTKNNWWE